MPLPSRAKKLLIAVGIPLWLGAALWGAKLLHTYNFSPGADGKPAVTWPADAGVSRAEGIYTLVVALHPDCPCSRATLVELDAILVETTPRLRAIVVFLDTDPDRSAGSSDLFKTAHQLPGVTLVRDRDGSELRRFDFLTSGETRLYQPDGALVFKGGITLSRGHPGANPGRTAVIDAVRQLESTAVQTPVFGCALFSAADGR
jgi:hypothetical protein